MEIEKEVVTFLGDEIIFRQGDPSESLYIIRSGKVKIVRENEGEYSIVGVVGMKDFLGEGAILTGGSRSAHAISSEVTEAVKIKYSEIKNVLESKPEWIKDLMEVLVGKLNNSSRVMSEHNIQLDEFEMMDNIEKKHLESILSEKQ